MSTFLILFVSLLHLCEIFEGSSALMKTALGVLWRLRFFMLILTGLVICFTMADTQDSKSGFFYSFFGQYMILFG